MSRGTANPDNAPIDMQSYVRKGKNAPPLRLWLTKEGLPRNCVHNILEILSKDESCSGFLGWNELSYEIVKLRTPNFIGGETGPWTDVDDTMAANFLNDVHEINAAAHQIPAVATVIAQRHKFHPVRDYLDGLKWDQRKRIDDWLVQYLGAADSDYAREIGRKFLIGAVARARKPGCKMDNVLILEDEQGTLKSTAMRTLAGDDWFTDEGFVFGDKDAYQIIRGRWIVELSELESLRKAEAEQAKFFLSRQVDRFRPPYGRHVIDQPRQCVFVGTANPGAYLKDQTGNRRYWPIATGKIRLDDLRRDRDQLWAEANDLYRSGHPWWVDGNPENFVAEQDKRLAHDPWEVAIQEYLDSTTAEYVTTSEILREACRLPLDRHDRAAATRVGTIVGRLGWLKRRRSVQPQGGGVQPQGGGRLWVYVRSSAILAP